MDSTAQTTNVIDRSTLPVRERHSAQPPLIRYTVVAYHGEEDGSGIPLAVFADHGDAVRYAEYLIFVGWGTVVIRNPLRKAPYRPRSDKGTSKP